MFIEDRKQGKRALKERSIKKIKKRERGE